MKLYNFLPGYIVYNIICVMKKILALLGITAFSCGVVYSAEFVYPQGKYNRTVHDNVYFMGVLDKGETLYCQNEEVKAAKNGAFAVNVPVPAGRSQVFLKVCKGASCSIKQYYIIKQKPKQNEIKQTAFTPLGKTMFLTISDRVPLYNTPDKNNMEILSHLSENTYLIVEGRQGDFFKVYLTPTRYAWVKTKDVRMVYDNTGYPAKAKLADFYNIDDKNIPDLSMYRVAFSHNVPYEVIDNPNELIINIFNISGMNDETLILKVAKHELVKYSTEFINSDFTLIMKGVKRDLSQPLGGLTIVIDAGHGGMDNGALGIFRDYEKDINLQVALRLKKALEEKGASVYLTRNTDFAISEEDRAKIAKANNANIFVSLHMSTVPQGENPLTNNGTGVYYYNNSAKGLAENIKGTLISALSTADAGVKRSGDIVLQPTEYLGVSVDLCSMVNPFDSEIYKSAEFAQKAADGITAGIVKFVAGKQKSEESGQLTNAPEGKAKKDSDKKWYEFYKKTNDDKQQTAEKKKKKIKVKAQEAPENFEAVPPENDTPPELKEPEEEKDLDSIPEKQKINWMKKLFNREKTLEINTEEEKPFLDTSVRDKYQQEAIYVIDKEDTKWYRPRGKKKRVKRPPRVIKQEIMEEEKPVNIFASGDTEEQTQDSRSLSTRCRDFLSKFTSYFYNAARN